MRKFAKYWRESASLLILARDGNKVATKNTYNYKVLAFKRTEKTSFMPNSIVFPGGAYDKQDESPQWNKFLTQMGISNKVVENFTKVQGTRPFIFENSNAEAVDRNISLRLNALREAFEELGVLFGHKKDQAGISDTGFSRSVRGFDIVSWQKAVHDQQKTFLELCESLDIVPDISNTYEWSAWLTPALFRKRRFETVFYLLAVDEQPTVHAEPHEVHEYMWDTPAGFLQAHKNEKLWLAPPQCYELTRLSHMYDIDEVVQFAKARNNLGSQLFCPVQYQCADAAIFVLPGDDMYPKDYDYVTPHDDLNKYQSMTAKEFRHMATNLHRTEHTNLHTQVYHQTVDPTHGHLSLNGTKAHLSKL